jgi:hypothetical protein
VHYSLYCILTDPTSMRCTNLMVELLVPSQGLDFFELPTAHRRLNICLSDAPTP